MEKVKCTSKTKGGIETFIYEVALVSSFATRNGNISDSYYASIISDFLMMDR